MRAQVEPGIRLWLEVNLIVPIQAHAISMFKDGLDAFAREDVELARTVVTRDKQLDKHESLCKPAVDRTDVAGPL